MELESTADICAYFLFSFFSNVNLVFSRFFVSVAVPTFMLIFVVAKEDFYSFMIFKKCLDVIEYLYAQLYAQK